MSSAGAWQVWIDRGGTFTDIVARRPDGELESLKLLSEAPERYADAGIEYEIFLSPINQEGAILY